MSCSICTQDLLEEQQKITLLCNHGFHTNCFLTRYYNFFLSDIHCHSCNEIVITATGTDEEAERKSKLDLVKSQLPIFHKLYKDLVKVRNKFHKKEKEIHKEFKIFIKPQVSILKNYRDSKIKIIKQLDEYKNYTKIASKLKRKIKNVATKYNIDTYDINNYLERNKIRFRFSYRYHNIRYRVMRKFRIRI